MPDNILEESLDELKKRIKFYEKRKLDILQFQVNEIMEHLKTI